MQMKKTANLNARWCNACIWLLALSWFLGLVLGGSFAVKSSLSLISLMRTVTEHGVSIVGLLGVTALPFLFTAVAVYFDQPWLLPVIAFCKAFLWSYTGCLIVRSFDTAGWLVRFLVLFTDSASLPLLFYLWLTHLQRRMINYCFRFGVCLACIAAVAVVDYLMVSPFLALLIE